MAQENQENRSGKISRRDILAGLAAFPLVGLIGYGLFKNKTETEKRNSSLLGDIRPEVQSGIPPLIEGDVLRVGIVGCGGRGGYLMKAMGFVNPQRIDEYAEKGKTDKYWVQYLEDFRAQEGLNLKITAICDIFDTNARRAMEAGANVHRNGKGGKMDDVPKRYTTYKELIASDDVDAVIIATPDHWHVPVALEAARNGKHVYCEKPLSWSVSETYEICKAVKETGIVFQLGHQGRQTESYNVARSLIKQGVIGKISLIEVCTNRNDPNGAWVYDINPEANEKTIDWMQFIGQAPWHDFSLERFFRWRCWWDYSTGLSGDLFTHEFDALNQILDLGIPNSAMASGGIYFFKDGRTVPDVLNMAMEYSDRDLTLLYSATLASEKNRGKVIMGHDAYLELSDTLIVSVDPRSSRYKEKLEQGLIEPFKPIYSYVPGQGSVDAITSPTEKYFAGRGLLYTYRDGKAVDSTHLHLREWINCIRAGKGAQPSCNIDQAFQEAMCAHMGTISYKEGRRTYWDKEKEVIV
jgi:predicted dehydrogenase